MPKEATMEKEKTLKEDVTVIKLAKIAEWLCSLEMDKPIDQADFVASRVASGYLLCLAQDIQQNRSQLASRFGIFNNRDVEV